MKDCLRPGRLVATERVILEYRPEERLVRFEIDGKEVVGEKGETVLEVARRYNIKIPTLCYHSSVSTFGGCRLCVVEVTKGKRTRIVPSCVFPISDGIVVKTATDKNLNIPSIYVYIKGTKFYQKNLFGVASYRNILLGIIQECLAMRDYIKAKRYIDLGTKIDKKNKTIYVYYKGTIFRRQGNYARAARYFHQVLNRVKLEEFKKLSLAKLGMCYQAMGEASRRCQA